jgi:hypothetical protein
MLLIDAKQVLIIGGGVGGGGGGGGMTPFQSIHTMAFGATVSGNHFTASSATVWNKTKVWLNGILLVPADVTLDLIGTVTLTDPISHPDGGVLMVETFESV